MEFANTFVVLGIIFGFSFGIVALVFYTDYRKRLLRHQERLAAIEKGILPSDLDKPSRDEAPCGMRNPYHGVTTLFVGIGLAVALYVTGGAKLAVWGLFVALIGVGRLLQGYLTRRSLQGQGS